MAVERGIHADAMMPEFCRQHEGQCYALKKSSPISMGIAKNYFKLFKINVFFLSEGEIMESDFGRGRQDSSLNRRTGSSPWYSLTEVSLLTGLKLFVIFVVLIMLFVRRRILISNFVAMLRSTRFIAID